MLTKMTNALRDRSGIASIEYGVLALGIIGVVVAGVAILGPDITAMFTAVGTLITSAS